MIELSNSLIGPSPFYKWFRVSALIVAVCDRFNNKLSRLISPYFRRLILRSSLWFLACWSDEVNPQCRFVILTDENPWIHKLNLLEDPTPT
jgi:hypothetical protein